jgi:hypothetical protein
MITEIVPNKKKFAIKRFILNFNGVAENFGSPYYIYNDCIYLSKKGFFNGFEELPIYYDEYNDYFYFPTRISVGVFNQIKLILENIPERVKIDLR